MTSTKILIERSVYRFPHRYWIVQRPYNYEMKWAFTLRGAKRKARKWAKQTKKKDKVVWEMEL